jgi:hypothetical protein
MRITGLVGSMVLACAFLVIPVTSGAMPRVGVVVSVRVAPPILPVYAQPICPGPGYIWEPGYWAYSDEGYYWVPGTWVLPPRFGLLWTPGYWGFADGLYVWHVGYWGPAVGFYGGINYGFGYSGSGFYGGYWRGDQYFYNTRVTKVNRTIIHNVYNTNVTNQRESTNRVSFNGGPHGVNARPTSSQLSAARLPHVPMTSEQLQHQRAASTNRTMLASLNHGRPDVAASTRPEPLADRPAAPHNRAANTERPATSKPAARPVPAPKSAPSRAAHPSSAAPKSEPSRPERTPAHPSTPAPSSRPAPANPNNRPTHHSTPAAKPVAPQSERSVTNKETSKPVPRSSGGSRSNVQRPSTTHTPPHQTQQHAAPPRSSTPTNQHPQPTKPEHPEH